jgi:homoserine dehydrogenase
MKNIILLGPGNVGRSFIKQASISIDKGAPLRIQAIADSKTILYKKEGFSTQEVNLICLTQFEIVKTVEELIDQDSILVDNSATDKTVPSLLKAIEKEAGIVLANKIPLTYDKDNSLKILHYKNTRYEATVGAGLPVITSLRRILSVKDEIENVIGLVSGTLGYVCSQMDNGEKYSDIIHIAHTLGYTEPDPRDDLGGMDAARKALILGRTCGWDLSLEDVIIEPLYNTENKSVSVDEFMESLDQDDEKYENLVKQAMKKNQVLRYLIQVTPENVSARLQSVSALSSFGSLKGTENRVEFHTNIFNSPPLAICGAGAGSENTAAGILADVLELV